jgi:large subunit ribosomal protein L2
MSLKYLKPVNSSSRGVVLVDKSDLWKGRPLKELTVGLRKSGGRNNRGVVTIQHRGGGHRQLYRKIDFLRNKEGRASIERIEYDPNRSAFISLIKYEDDSLSYVLCAEGLKVGDIIECGNGSDIKVGNTLQLNYIPAGNFVHNVELNPGKGGVLGRSAGIGIYLAGKECGFAILRMPSGEMRKVSLECRATIGKVSNGDHQHIVLGKAGRSRMRGRRPIVRGVAKNPVDHRNGGDTSGGKHFSNEMGTVRKGQRSRSKKKAFSHMILKRRKK